MGFHGWKKNSITDEVFGVTNMYGKETISIDNLGAGITIGTFDKFPNVPNLDGQGIVITLVYMLGWRIQFFFTPHGIYKIWVRKSYTQGIAWNEWREISLNTI